MFSKKGPVLGVCQAPDPSRGGDTPPAEVVDESSLLGREVDFMDFGFTM